MVCGLIVANFPAGAKSPQPHVRILDSEELPVNVLLYVGQFCIVQSRPPEPGVVKPKAQWLYQVQAGTGIGAQTDDISGVWWNFRLVENNVQHDCLSAMKSPCRAVCPAG